MSDNEWRYAVASVVGTSHQSGETSCQDASACQVLAAGDGASALVAIAADGAGSAAQAEIGAQVVVAALLDAIEEFYCEGGGVKDLTLQDVGGWLDRALADIDGVAEVEGLGRRDFACTVLVALIEDDAAAFGQIGDGAIVTSTRAAPLGYAPVFWPERGEYANQTHFVTDVDAEDHLAFARWNERVDEVALFTDGIQSLALLYSSKAAHAPFFAPVFAPVRAEPPGCSARLSLALARFLESRQVNQRTDDDKTLILATRRSDASPR